MYQFLKKNVLKSFQFGITFFEQPNLDKPERGFTPNSTVQDFSAVLV